MSIASLRNKKYFEIGLLLSQYFSFKAYKTYILAILTHLVLKLYKNIRYLFKATTDTADKGKFYNICSVSERNFCNGLEIKFAQPPGGMEQADALETDAKSVTPYFYLRFVTYKRLGISLLFIVTNFHTKAKPQVNIQP